MDDPNEVILKNKIVAALRSNGIEAKVTSIDLSVPPELIGEHLATEAICATIHFFDNCLPPKNLFVKKFSTNPNYAEILKKMKVMEKESLFFQNFLPELRQFCAKLTRCNLLNFFPEFFFGDDSCVILENVVLDRGFSMLDKDEMQDYETAKIVLSNLAKFHACTYAFIEKMGRDKFRTEFNLSITESFEMRDPGMTAGMFDNGIGTCIQILKDNPMTGSVETIENLKNLLGKILPEINQLLKRDESEPLLVLNHGDCWNNNMLFRKDTKTELITDQIFVDFQVTRYGSPCLDLGFFYFTSIKPEVRKAHWQDFLHLYHEQFDATAQLLGTKCPITYDNLVKAFKRFCKLGYYLSLSMQSTIGAFKGIDMASIGTNPEEIMTKFNAIIRDWIKRNPEQANTITKNLIDLVQEFQELQA